MSSYSFLPWVRQGLARKIQEVDTLGANDGAVVERASIDVSLSLGYFAVGSDTRASDTLLVERTAQLLGPGDAAGIRPKAIIESVPAPGSQSFPASHLAYVTFFEEDFPWCRTPAAPAGQKLRPWLALLVLKADEHELTKRPEQLRVLTVKAAAARAVLPPPEELWAWAHVHATSQIASAAELEQLQKQAPNLALSRILAPRRLQPNVAYRAYLVPAFETGRRSGLGESVDGVPAQKPAWPTQADYAPGGSAAVARDIRLPVYHHWSFGTQAGGDFETLVSALLPRVAGAEFGVREMEVSSPGFGLDGILTNKTLSLEGALRPPLHQPATFPELASPAEQQYVRRLEQVLDLTANLASPDGAAALPTLHPFSSPAGAGGFEAVADDPILVPPTYGQWHALVARLADTPAAKTWLRDLNLDPRQRAAAGVGAQIVQARDDELVERAWEQIGEVLAANQKLREAELATHVAQGMHQKHVAPLDDDRLMMYARSAQASVVDVAASRTVRGCIDDSPIPAAALSAAFRRAARPQRKGLRRAMGGDGRQTTLQSGLITGLNATSLAAAAPKTAFASSVTIAQVEQAVALAATQVVKEAQTPSHLFVRLLWEDLRGRAGALPNLGFWKAELLAGATSPEVTALIRGIVSASATTVSARVEVDRNVFNAHFEEGVKAKSYNGLLVEASAAEGRVSRAVLEADVDRYRRGVEDFRKGALAGVPPTSNPTPRGDLGGVAATLRAELAPSRALALRVSHLVLVGDDTRLTGSSPARVMAYPRFPEPQFEYLKQLSYDFIIPNVQGLPPNTITLLEANQRFIEAFLAGMNHEMARELLWREYPTDRRGTYFDRFWAAGDSLADEPDPDISPLDSWTNALGENSGRPGTAPLVLTIRSELFRQYPRTLVYAQRAVWQSDGHGVRRDLPRRLKDPVSEDDLKFPAFDAELEPDIGIFAFELDPAAARGQGDDAGWFFVLKERPGQPRFGADEGAAGTLEDWNDLAYAHLRFPPETPELLRILGNTGNPMLPTSNDATRPIAARWGRSAADTAYALLQAPVLYARHAAEMLPSLPPV